MTTLAEEVLMLRARVQYLEDQLRIVTARFPLEWKLTGQEARLMRSLVVRAHPTTSQIVEDIWWDADEPENAVRQVRVIMERTRRKLRPFGIEIRNVVRQGYYLPEETRLALRERIGLGRIG